MIFSYSGGLCNRVLFLGGSRHGIATEVNNINIGGGVVIHITNPSQHIRRHEEIEMCDGARQDHDKLYQKDSEVSI